MSATMIATTLQTWIPIPVYIALVYTAQRVMCVRDVRTMRTVHNLLLSTFSALIALSISLVWVARGHGPRLCAAPPAHIPMIYTAWYYSKLWEWVDTYFIIRSGRRIQRLHYYHHMSTVTLTGLQTWRRSAHTSLMEIGMFLNAVVHVIMYSYYAYPSRLMSIRRAITVMQLGQHVVVIAAIVHTLLTQECDRDATGNMLPLLMYAFYAMEFGWLAFERVRKVSSE